MQPLVSVIVPIYKVEDSLVRCLDSLCRQSLSNIEILLIDDASPDRCGIICEEYAMKDDRLKVIHHLRSLGLSAARNTGIANATSSYLMFVDSDDYVYEDFCKEAYECANSFQADLVMFKFEHVKNSKHFVKGTSGSFMQSGFKTQLEATDFLKEWGDYAWNKLYRKELFLHISYPVGYMYEDIGTTYKLIWKANRIYYLNKILYHYCNRMDSITTQKTEKLLNDYYEMFTQQCNDLAAWGYPPNKLQAVLQVYSLKYCILFCSIKNKPFVSEERFALCANVLCNSENIQIQLPWKRKTLYVLFKHCRPLFKVLCILHGRGIL